MEAAYDTQNTRVYAALSAVTWYTEAIISSFDLDPNDHTRHAFRNTTRRACIHGLIYRYQAIYSMISLNIAWYTENSRYDSKHMLLNHQCLIPGICKSFSCHMKFLILIFTHIRRNSLFHGCSLYCAFLRRWSRLCLGSSFGFVTDYPIRHDRSTYTRPYTGTAYVSEFIRTYCESRVGMDCLWGAEANFNP